MKKTISLYYLYCMNAKCQVSIYHRMLEVRLPFTAENLVSTHLCAFCNKPLVSSIDMEIKYIVAEATTRANPKVNYLNN